MQQFKNIIRFAILLCLLTNVSNAQSNKTDSKLHIQVGENILVGSELSNHLIEPRITAHPSNPNHLLAVGWVFPASGKQEDLDVEHCACFVSKDGGLNWIRNDLLGKGCADPWVTLSENGAILTALGKHPSLPDSESKQLMAYFSSDGGFSWSKIPQSLGYNHDGPRSVASFDRNTYVVSSQYLKDDLDKSRFSIYVARSLPTKPFIEKTTSIVPSNLNLNPDGVTTLSDGSLVVTYQDFQRPVNGFKNRNGVLKTRREWVIVSSDKGKTFTMPKLITESCYDRANDLVADTTSSKYRDRLYCTCSGKDYKSVLITYSKDRGEEWSDAVPIELPEQLKGIRREPQVAVNKNGILAVAWMDGRDDSSGKCFTPYIVVSSDGGQTFSDAVKIGNKLSCPDSKKSDKFVPNRWPTGGDYFGLTAGADGVFHVLWSDARNGKFEIMTAAVSVSKSVTN